MAYLGGVYLHTVISEKADRSSEMTEKPVETGTNIADHIKKSPLSLELDVVLTQAGANYTRNRLVQLWQKDTKLTYRGEHTYHNLYISHIGEISESANQGGYSLELRLEQPRVAKLSTYKVKVKNPVTKKQDAKTATKVNQTTNIGTQPKEPPINRLERNVVAGGPLSMIQPQFMIS